MKRALLIATGTVGGLGAVLSITPPQIGANRALMPEVASSGLSSSSVPSTSTSATTSAAPGNTSKIKNSSAASKSGAVQNSNQNSKPTASKAPEVKPSNVVNSYTGDAVDIGYGIVQVKITVSDGKITDAVAVQAPYGRSQRWSDMSVPSLRSQTLQVQSAAINGVSGASYTSYGWYQSLISALQKAGMSTGV